MNKNNNKMSQKKRTQRVQHMFRRIRDPIVSDATNGASPSAFALSTDSSGNASTSIVLSPFGVRAVQVLAGSGATTTFTDSNYFPAVMPWLYNQARNFERYRVLNATLILIGNVGSSATGRVVVDSSTDVADNLSPITIGTSTGGKVFDLANLSSKEYRFSLDVDSGWKKCSSRTAGFSSDSTKFLPINTVNDLVFSNAYIAIVSGSTGGTPSAFTALNFAIEYDVEFKDPISYGVNY